MPQPTEVTGARQPGVAHSGRYSGALPSDRNVIATEPFCAGHVGERETSSSGTQLRAGEEPSGRDGRVPHCPFPALGQMVTKREDEQGVEHVECPEPTWVKLRVGEERL